MKRFGSRKKAQIMPSLSIIILVLSCVVLLSGCLLIDKYTIRFYPLPNGRYRVVVRYDNIESYRVDKHSKELTSTQDEQEFLDDFNELVNMVKHPDEDGQTFGDTGICFHQLRLWVEDHTLYGEAWAECSEEEFLSKISIQKTATAYIWDFAEEEDEEVKHLVTNGTTRIQDGHFLIVWPIDTPVLEVTITALEERPRLERSLADLFVQQYPDGIETVITP